MLILSVVLSLNLIPRTLAAVVDLFLAALISANFLRYLSIFPFGKQKPQVFRSRGPLGKFVLLLRYTALPGPLPNLWCAII